MLKLIFIYCYPINNYIFLAIFVASPLWTRLTFVSLSWVIELKSRFVCIFALQTEFSIDSQVVALFSRPQVHKQTYCDLVISTELKMQIGHRNEL